MSRNLGQIAQIKAYGVDLDKKRQIDLTLWAPDEAAAKVFLEASKRNEMPPNLTLGPASPRDANQRWLIRCPFAASVTFITTKENVVTFLLFAANTIASTTAGAPPLWKPPILVVQFLDWPATNLKIYLGFCRGILTFLLHSVYIPPLES